MSVTAEEPAKILDYLSGYFLAEADGPMTGRRRHRCRGAHRGRRNIGLDVNFDVHILFVFGGWRFATCPCSRRSFHHDQSGDRD
jgi:hypothetical protein